MKSLNLSYGEISTLCLELSLFLHAGADISAALVLLAEECADTHLSKILLKMSQQIDNGLSLSTAMEEAKIFPHELWSMLRIAEKSGYSEKTLHYLSKYYEQRERMNHQLHSALLSPSILLLIMVIVIIVLLTQVLPIFNDVYASLGGQMSGIAGHLFHFGQLLNAILPFLSILLIAAAIGIFTFCSVETFRNRIFAFVFSKQNIYIKRAHFAQALSMTLSSGISHEEALESAALLLQDRRCENCKEFMIQGYSFAEALEKTELLPARECRLLSLGLSSGSEEYALAEIAQRMTQSAENELERCIGLVEPIMVISASILVGMILLTAMLPLARIMSAMG